MAETVFERIVRSAREHQEALEKHTRSEATRLALTTAFPPRGVVEEARRVEAVFQEATRNALRGVTVIEKALGLDRWTGVTKQVRKLRDFSREAEALGMRPAVERWTTMVAEWRDMRSRYSIDSSVTLPRIRDLRTEAIAQLRTRVEELEARLEQLEDRNAPPAVTESDINDDPGPYTGQYL